MKFTKRTGIFLAAALICSGITVTSIINANEYSGDDPLISKSWVDNIFYPQIVQYVDGKIEELKNLLSPSTVSPDTAQTPPTDTTVSTPEGTPLSLSYEVITLTKGQRLVSSEGSLEIILRPGGEAAVYSEIEGNGVADLTVGTELLSGAAVPINSYCLIPRADGRGIVCTSENAYVMVRGKYAIV